MLLLAALMATATWSSGFAQQTLVQKPLSVSKSKGSVRLECYFKGDSLDFDNIIIHWYQKKVNNSPERILYFTEGQKIVDDGFQANRYIIEKVPARKLYILTIKDVIPDDTAVYYCAFWHIHSARSSEITWTNTISASQPQTTQKIPVTSLGVDKVSSPPANSEILQMKHDDQITYVCLIERFYPEVIRVTWTDGENKEITDNVAKGDAWKSTKGDEYSIGSWLTVPAENKDKNYYCNYEHERGQHPLSTQEATKTAHPEEDCSTYPGNGTVFNRDNLMHRTAYLVYLILLLKSSMYYLIVLFFLYRMWAPAKNQRKQA